MGFHVSTHHPQRRRPKRKMQVYGDTSDSTPPCVPNQNTTCVLHPLLPPKTARVPPGRPIPPGTTSRRRRRRPPSKQRHGRPPPRRASAAPTDDERRPLAATPRRRRPTPPWPRPRRLPADAGRPSDSARRPRLLRGRASARRWRPRAVSRRAPSRTAAAGFRLGARSPREGRRRRTRGPGWSWSRRPPRRSRGGTPEARSRWQPASAGVRVRPRPGPPRPTARVGARGRTRRGRTRRTRRAERAGRPPSAAGAWPRRPAASRARGRPVRQGSTAAGAFGLF